MHCLETSILKTVAYFAVFNYPLTVEEINFFLDRPVGKSELLKALQNLIQTKQLWQSNNFFSLHNKPGFAERRIHGNKLAIKLIKRARTVAKFLSWFPYVKGIAISGSLSKHFADEDSDLDFFVITKANRLWILRMLFGVLFKIALICGMKKWFCINYIIDEHALLIEEKNIFTAIEISTLLPLKGEAVFNDFFKVNNWVYEYLPNHAPDYSYMKDVPPHVIKQMFEWLINAIHANKLNERSMLFFKQRFSRFFAKQIVIEKDFIVGSYIVTKHVYKPMPQYLQSKIILQFQELFLHVKNKHSAVNAMNIINMEV